MCRLRKCDGLAVGLLDSGYRGLRSKPVYLFVCLSVFVRLVAFCFVVIVVYVCLLRVCVWFFFSLCFWRQCVSLPECLIRACRIDGAGELPLVLWSVGWLVCVCVVVGFVCVLLLVLCVCCCWFCVCLFCGNAMLTSASRIIGFRRTSSVRSLVRYVVCKLAGGLTALIFGNQS